ncbi:MAG: ABC transporter ATP-binding protein [Hyphomicrobiales bacterium]|nr:ABC transporter ATP-binding protein [Hyphomicrobiales bacterium]
MSEVRLESVRKRYGSAMAVERVSLTIGEGEFVTLLGASGSGKTTCLRMVAGFVYPDEGRVYIADAEVTRTPPHKRATAMVFQQYALFPHLNVAQNVAFGLKVRRLNRAEIDARVREVLSLVRLDGLAERMPNQLSGGQKQRVALARAVVLKPQILLLDEPLAALDLKLREELQLEIKRVQTALGVTTLFVTHDQGEALDMSDRVAVMHKGRIVQVDTPAELYQAPANGVVAQFIGRMTIFPARIKSIENGICLLCDNHGGDFKTRHWPKDAQTGEAVLLTIRPEAYRIDAHLDNVCKATLDRVLYQGTGWLCQASESAERRHTVSVPLTANAPKIGERVFLSWRAEDCRAIRET